VSCKGDAHTWSHFSGHTPDPKSRCDCGETTWGVSTLPAPPPLVGGAEREQESDHGAGLIHQVASPKAETEPRPNSEELAFISELIEKKRASLRARIDSVNAWRDGDEAEHRAGHALAEKMAGRKLAYVDAAGREARAKLDEKIGNKHAHEIVLLENIARALNGSGNQPASAERAQATRRSAAQEKPSNSLPPSLDGSGRSLPRAASDLGLSRVRVRRP
jgi:hypothetical protein